MYYAPGPPPPPQKEKKVRGCLAGWWALFEHRWRYSNANESQFGGTMLLLALRRNLRMLLRLFGLLFLSGLLFEYGTLESVGG